MMTSTRVPVSTLRDGIDVEEGTGVEEGICVEEGISVEEGLGPETARMGGATRTRVG